MLNILYTTGLVLCPLVITCLLVSSLRACLRRHEIMTSMILGYTLVHETILVTAPNYFALASSYRFEKEMTTVVEPGDLARVMFGEMVFMCCFLFAFMRCGRGRPHRTPEGRRPLKRSDLLALVIISVIAIGGYGVALSQPVVSLAESALHAEFKVYRSVSEMLGMWLFTAVQIPAIFCASILLVARRVPTAARLLGISLHVCLVLLGVLGGSRGRITWSLCAVVGIAIAYGSRRVAIYGLAILFLTVSGFSFLGNGFYRWFLLDKLKGQSQFSALSFAVDEFRDDPLTDEGSGFIPSLMSRAMGSRNSVVLYNLWDEGSGATYRPILSALVFPIPRALWQDKPPVGSIDSSPYGGAMFTVMRLGHGAPWYVMGPFLPSAHAYWEAGPFGVVLAGFLTGLIWATIVRFSGKLSLPVAIVVIMTFMSSLLIDGLYTANVPLFGLIRMTYVASISFGIVLLFRMFSGRKRKNANLSDPRNFYQRLGAAERYVAP